MCWTPTLVLRIMQVALKRTFLSIFINKEELIITGSITNQFYLDKTKQT